MVLLVCYDYRSTCGANNMTSIVEVLSECGMRLKYWKRRSTEELLWVEIHLKWGAPRNIGEGGSPSGSRWAAPSQALHSPDQGRPFLTSRPFYLLSITKFIWRLLRAATKFMRGTGARSMDWPSFASYSDNPSRFQTLLQIQITQTQKEAKTRKVHKSNLSNRIFCKHDLKIIFLKKVPISIN